MLAAYDCHGDWDFFNLQYLSQTLLGQDIMSYADLVEPNHTFLGIVSVSVTALYVGLVACNRA